MRPILFRLPAFGHPPVYSYGVMLALSLAAGWYLTLWLCERDGMDRSTMAACYLWTAAAALIGARLLFVLTNLERFGHFVDLFRLNHGGLVAYGGFLGGLVGSAVYCRQKGVRLLAWADCAVPSLCVGLMVTRVGCFMYGCDFGKPWDGPWAVRFPAGSPAFRLQVQAGLLDPRALRSLPVHPAQLYSSLAGLALLALVLTVRRYRRFSGAMLVAFTLGYAVLRYYIETLRDDPQRGALGPFSTSQLIAILTFAAALLLLGWLRMRARVDPQGARLWEAGRATVRS